MLNAARLPFGQIRAKRTLCVTSPETPMAFLGRYKPAQFDAEKETFVENLTTTPLYTLSRKRQVKVNTNKKRMHICIRKLDSSISTLSPIAIEKVMLGIERTMDERWHP